MNFLAHLNSVLDSEALDALNKANELKAAAKANKLTIDDEFKQLIPPLTADEYNRLEESILREGCRDPLIIWDNVLIDGHNRYAICNEHDIPYKTVKYVFSDRDEVKLWMMKNQLARRNLTDIQRINIVRKCEDAIKADANKRMKSGKADPMENFPQGTSRDALGKLAGVSGKTYEHATKVIDEAPTEIVRAVDNKELSIDAAYAVTKMNDEDKQEVVERISDGESAKAVVSEVRNRPHVANNSGNNEWYTPAEYIALAREVMGTIDLDPASNDIANKTVQADTYYTETDSGLEHDWFGNVWLNPPYANELITKFVDKMMNEFENFNTAIVLVNNATETEWFRTLISECSAICFTNSRVKFYSPDGRIAQPLQGQALLYFGDNPKKFVDVFSAKGWCAYPA